MKPRLQDGIRRHQPAEILRFVVHLPSFARLFLGLFRDARVGTWAKFLLLAAVGYILSPIDLLPDIAPILGQMDDLAVLTMACRTFIQMCPRPVVSEHVAKIDTSGEWRPFNTDQQP